MILRGMPPCVDVDLNLSRDKINRIVFSRDKINRIVQEMIDVMQANDGIGLAAPQIGYNLNLIVIDEYVTHLDNKRYGHYCVMVNPTLEPIYSKGVNQDVEACLSVPGRFGSVERFNEVKVDYQTLDGFSISVNTYNRLYARVLQHEYDHLRGVLYYDHILGGYSALSKIKQM